MTIVFFGNFVEFLKQEKKHRNFLDIENFIKVQWHSYSKIAYLFFEAVQFREIDHRILPPPFQRFETYAANQCFGLWPSKFLKHMKLKKLS